MDTLRKIREKWPIFALLALYIYLAFHALSGSQGVMRWVDYERDSKRLSTRLEAVIQTRKTLESHTDSLKSSNLNLDSLDMASREIIFTSHPNEKTIWLDLTD